MDTFCSESTIKAATVLIPSLPATAKSNEQITCLTPDTEKRLVMF